MTATDREAIRRARDKHTRTRLGRSTGGRPYRRAEESDQTETMPGAWMPVRSHRPRKPGPFFALAAYEGEEC